MKRNVYDRFVLYEEVWQSPIRKVAKRYGISDMMLKKICKQLDVPTPPRGYWAKLAAGKKVKIPKLPKPSTPGVKYGMGLNDQDHTRTQQIDPLSLLGDAELETIRSVACGITHHPKARLRPELSELKQQGCSTPVMRVNYPQTYSFSDFVSSKQARRAAAILETIVRALEKVGGYLSGPLTVKALGETVDLEVRESTVKEKHTLSMDEKRELAEYERTKYSWYKPNIRKWDNRFSGSLSLTVLTGANRYSGTDWTWSFKTSFNERSGTPLEEQIPDIFLAVCRVCAAKRLDRLDMDARAKRHADDVAVAQRRVDCYNSEVTMLERALEEANRYADASRLRAYAVQLASKPGDGPRNYAAWILRKADWLDPTVSADDEIFGQFDASVGAPKRIASIDPALPYDIRWFYDRVGDEPNQTWQHFTDAVAKS